MMAGISDHSGRRRPFTHPCTVETGRSMASASAVTVMEFARRNSAKVMSPFYAHCGFSRKREFCAQRVPRAATMGDAGAMPKQVNDLSNAAKVLQANLKRWRKARKMTLKQLAERTGYAVSTLSGWENGDREVGTEDLMRLASEYGYRAQHDRQRASLKNSAHRGFSH
ncbi:MAG: XRE family transcriptional regulator [Caulobacteraceae bacterium]|nr:XRE family transcriptional regulator [Caulobacteraceae bacterium]